MKRWGLIGGGLLLLIGCILFGIIAYMRANPRETAETRVQAAVLERARAAKALDASQNSDSPDAAPPSSTSPDAASSNSGEAEPGPDAAGTIVDFEDLWSMNPEIYAWLYIPDTNINYPILQREGDDEFYLRHNSEGRSRKAASIYTESAYTSKDFTDPVTVLYGHSMRSGDMFGSLQTIYSSLEGMQAHRQVIVYLPERELYYDVFAAVPHDSKHLLYHNDFTDPEVFQAFLEEVLSTRSINAVIDQSVEVTVEDRILILSTCLRGDAHQRFLVLAKRTGEDPPHEP